MKSIVNFRDLGGLKTSSGKIVKKESLLRSGAVDKVREEELTELLEKYRLRTIIDLRSSREIKEKPDISNKNITYKHIDILEGEKNTASLENLKSVESIKEAQNMMKELYCQLAFDKNSNQKYTQFLKEVINEKTGTILFHCSAGKDRTGFGAFLLLANLGVNKEDIFKDYLLTNKGRAEENKKIINFLKTKNISENKIEALNVTLNVEEDFLETTINLINKKYGNFENYCDKCLNFTNHDRQKLKEKYLIEDNKSNDN